MATYFHGAPEMQGDGLHTLYLLNQGGYATYADAVAPGPGNALLFSATANPANSINLAPAGSLQPCRHQQQHFVDVPGGHGHVSRLPHNLDTSAARLDLRKGLSLTLSPQAIAPASAEIAVATASSGIASFLMGSRYSNAARQLLNEIVSIGSGTNGDLQKGANSKKPAGNNHPKVTEENTSAKRGADLTNAERQELHTKKAKLLDMLDEAEQRHIQYRHQMQTVVAKFEEVAGQGSAETYTRLALRTISKQFRCLRDAISGQIRAIGKSLGEEDEDKSQRSGLRFLNHHLRRQRALRQLGLLQQNPWRPQRGLPERSVSLLRAWLFEHFLHPYPKDSDKLMLAKQTGLSRSQVSNWFINARVRLWKPMVEAMYMEENKDEELSHANEHASKTDANGGSYCKSSSLSPTVDHQKQPLGAAASSANFYSEINGGGDYGGAYTIGELGRFEGEEHFAAGLSGNGVSLTLGLQHSDHASLARAQPPYLSLDSMQLEGRLATGTEASEYCSLNNTAAAVSSNSAFRTIDGGLLMNYYYQTL